jgi:hypothetical protein
MKHYKLLCIVFFVACSQLGFAQLTANPTVILPAPKLHFVDSLQHWKQNNITNLFQPERVDEYYVRKSKKFVELGFNVTRIFKALNDQDIVADTIPGNYLVTLKLHKGLTALRFGTAFTLNKKVVPILGQTSNRNTTINNVSFRAGIERQFRVHPRWTLSLGADLFASNSVRRTVVATSVDVVTTERQTIKYGAGPVVGLQWNAGRRISFGVELAGYYSIGKTYDRKKLQIDSNLNKTTIFKEPADWRFIAPNSLYLIFRL